MSDPVSATTFTTQVASLQKALDAGPSGAAASTAPVAGQGDSFVTVLGDMISGVNHDLQNAEAMSIRGIKGEADVQEVVHSLMSAEQSLKMAVAVRDKIVSAYLDISRMQI